MSRVLGIEENEIVTVVGAGGKSSLLLSLAREWKDEKRLFLLTATTKMLVEQVENCAPVFCGAYEEGVAQVLQKIAEHGYAAWFSGRSEQKASGEKALGVEAAWIEAFYQRFRGRMGNIIVEGDGARNRLLKIPGPGEPVVPQSCHRLVGVMNLQAIGRDISPRVIHRYELAASFLGRNEGRIQPSDLAVLALHPDGIFKNCSAAKVLVLTGADEYNTEVAADLAQTLVKASGGFAVCTVTRGFGEEMEPVAVFSKGVC